MSASNGFLSQLEAGAREAVALRWSSRHYQRDEVIQFADFRGQGWVDRAVCKVDKRGNCLGHGGSPGSNGSGSGRGDEGTLIGSMMHHRRE